MGKSFAMGNSMSNGPHDPWRNVPGGNPNTTHWDWTIGRNPAA